MTKCGSTLTAAEVTTDVKFFGLVKPRSTWICIKWPGAGGGTLTRRIKPDAKRNNFQSWFFVCLCVSLSAPAVYVFIPFILFLKDFGKSSRVIGQ